MSDYGLSEYKNIMTKMLKLMKENLPIVQDIKDANDPKWLRIVDDFKAIGASATDGMKDYADSMIRLHIFELERRWRH